MGRTPRTFSTPAGAQVEDARKQEIRAVSIQKRNLAVAMPREAAEIERKQAKRLRKMLDDLLRICKKHEKKMVREPGSARSGRCKEFVLYFSYSTYSLVDPSELW